MKTLRVQFDEELHRRLSLYAASHAMGKHEVILHAIQEKVGISEGRSWPLLGLKALKGALKGPPTPQASFERVRQQWKR